MPCTLLGAGRLSHLGPGTVDSARQTDGSSGGERVPSEYAVQMQATCKLRADSLATASHPQGSHP
jgi:hypothetical protein